jgi:hypothetical protein
VLARQLALLVFIAFIFIHFTSSKSFRTIIS